MSSEGLTVSDVFGWRGGKRAAKVKYRHPETGATFSGKGRKPRWLSEELAAGKKLEDFAV